MKFIKLTMCRKPFHLNADCIISLHPQEKEGNGGTVVVFGDQEDAYYHVEETVERILASLDA